MPRRWPVETAGWASSVRLPWRESRRRRAAWFALIFGVLLAHALFGLRVLSSVIGWNSVVEPRRIEITFSRTLAPTAPPAAPAVVAPPPAPAPRASPRAIRSAQASSAPAPASAPEEPEFHPVSPGEPPVSRALLVGQALALADKLERAQQAAEAASAASVAAARAGEIAAMKAVAASAAVGNGYNVAPVAGPDRQPMAWPPSTRLTYTLKGLYRDGPLYGKASVEWRRAGTHYQVQFDIHVSPFFDQHMFSDGQITDKGLSPDHYDESFDVPLLAPRVRRIDFFEDEVKLSNGNRVIKLPQTQDGASQFVQFVWMFTTRPALLRAGNVVDLPLALNNNLRRWHYQVVGLETLDLDFGQLDAVHLKPLSDGPRRPNEYPFEIWTAPSLQYLPVRILVPIDDKNYADLSLDALPLQAAPVPEGEAASQPMLR
jgi:hypothetical protein